MPLAQRSALLLFCGLMSVFSLATAASLNRALKRPVYQNQPDISSDPAKCVDGVDSCCTPNSRLHTWWAVDLQAYINITLVKIWPRVGLVENVYFGVTNTSVEEVEPSVENLNYEVCANFTGIADVYVEMQYVCQAPLTGRYLIIQRWDDKVSLGLCEVEVYGDAVGCLTNMVVKDCVPESQPSCRDLDPSPADECVPGCVCKPGTVYLEESASCVPVEEYCCEMDGQMYSTGEYAMKAEDCSVQCLCTNGTLDCQANRCDSGANCEVKDGVRGCHCKAGFSGDGRFCTHDYTSWSLGLWSTTFQLGGVRRGNPVDGTIRKCGTGTSVSDSRLHSWWAVDLRRYVRATRLHFFTNDRQYLEMTYYQMGFADVSPAVEEPVPTGYRVCAVNRYAHQQHSWRELECNGVGRYFIVQQLFPGPKRVMLCEIRIYGKVKYLGQECGPNATAIGLFGTCDNGTPNNFTCDNATEKCVCRLGYMDFSNEGVECFKRMLFDPCSTDDDCTAVIDDSVCHTESKTCRCIHGMYGNSDKECILIENLFDPCSLDSECTAIVNDSECNAESNICLCRSGWMMTDDNSTCTQRRISDECITDLDCSDAISNAVCMNGTCQCNDFYLLSDNDTCLARAVGDSCSSDEQCGYHMKHSECIDDICTCFPGYFDAECLAIIESPCNDNSDCSEAIDNSLCLEKFCQCEEGYNAESARVCSLVTTPPPNAAKATPAPIACDTQDDCQAARPNSECVDNVCQCQEGYVYSGDDCIRMTVGDSCGSDSQCAAAIKQSVCRDSTCGCPEGTAHENLSNECKPAIGASCRQDSDCAGISKAECVNGKCTCSVGLIRSESGFECVSDMPSASRDKESKDSADTKTSEGTNITCAFSWWAVTLVQVVLSAWVFDMD